MHLGAKSCVPPISRPFEPDWAAFARKTQTEWGKAILNALKAEFVEWEGRLQIPSSSDQSDWSHYYVNDVTGDPLVWNPLSPHEHLCPKTGKIHRGEPYNGAWRSMMHSANAAQVERSVVLFRAGILAEHACKAIDRIVGFYATHYTQYEIHGHRSGKGRIQSQNLDEAIWLITIFRCLRWSGLVKEMAASRKEALESMARAAIDLLRPQVCEVHNIHCWLLAALAECASFLEDESLIAWCWKNPVGIHNQIAFGFDDDGQWKEGSMTYHFYTLAALLSFIEAAGSGELRPPRGAQSARDYKAYLAESISLVNIDRLKRAFALPFSLAYADGRLPAYNDGWSDIYLDSNADLYEAASALLPECLGGDTVASVYWNARERPLQRYTRTSVPPRLGETSKFTFRGSVAALVYGEVDIWSSQQPAPAQSTLFSYSGIGLLKNSHVRLAVRFGPYGGGHEHLDKLGVDVETSSGWQSLDLGTSGYGATFTNDWQKTSVAHNVVVIDGRRQSASAGRLTAWSENTISVEAENAYPGICLRRTLTLAGQGWEDVFEVTAMKASRIDWVFHGDGSFEPETLKATPFHFDEANGYRMIAEASQAEVSGRLQGRWAHGSLIMPVTWELPAECQLFWGKAQGNPNGRPMSVVILRCIRKEAHIRARFGL